MHAAGGLLHVDAVQGAGRIDCDIDGARRRSAHDLVAQDRRPARAPVRSSARGDVHIAEPLIKGGGQERGARAGTENVAAIAGFGAAAARPRQAGRARLPHGAARSARSGPHGADAGVRSFSARVAPRLPNTTLFAVPGLKAETAIIAFDLNGIAVSSGSACSSGKVAALAVLAAMGVDACAGARRRARQPRLETTEADVDRFLEAWKKLAGSLLKERSGIAA